MHVNCSIWGWVGASNNDPAQGHSYSLRPHAHNRNRLSIVANCNFITRMLFYQSYWHLLPFMCFLLLIVFYWMSSYYFSCGNCVLSVTQWTDMLGLSYCRSKYVFRARWTTFMTILSSGDWKRTTGLRTKIDEDRTYTLSQLTWRQHWNRFKYDITQHMRASF